MSQSSSSKLTLTDFNYKLYGNPEGPKIVFLHGMMGYSSNWRSVILGLEESYHCLVYDQRGHGRSKKPTSGYHPKDYAADLYQVTQELHWDSFALVGHSMGGRNALEFAERHQNHLTKLIIEDISPELTPGSENYFNKLFSFVPTPFKSREFSKGFFENDFLGPASPYSGQITLSQFLSSNLETQSDGSVDWRFSKLAIQQTLYEMKEYTQWHILPKLSIPTLLIRGELSKDLTPNQLNRICDLNPLISGVEIKGAGHWVHFDRPQEFTQTLHSFLK